MVSSINRIPKPLEDASFRKSEHSSCLGILQVEL